LQFTALKAGDVDGWLILRHGVGDDANQPNLERRGQPLRVPSPELAEKAENRLSY